MCWPDFSHRAAYAVALLWRVSGAGGQEPPIQVALAWRNDSLWRCVMTIVRRGVVFRKRGILPFVPLIVVVTVLLFDARSRYFRPYGSDFFFGRDRAELQLLQNIEERLLTRETPQQFLETVLAACAIICNPLCLCRSIGWK
jgi:hypothetical protein